MRVACNKCPCFGKGGIEKFKLSFFLELESFSIGKRNQILKAYQGYVLQNHLLTLKQVLNFEKKGFVETQPLCYLPKPNWKFDLISIAGRLVGKGSLKVLVHVFLFVC